MTRGARHSVEFLFVALAVVGIAAWIASTHPNGLVVVREQPILTQPPESTELLRWERGRRTGLVSVSGDLPATTTVVWASRLDPEALDAYYQATFGTRYRFFLGLSSPTERRLQGASDVVGFSISITREPPVLDRGITTLLAPAPALTRSYVSATIAASKV